MIRHFIYFILIIWLVITFGGGKAIDNVCIKGKLKDRHAMAIEAVGWRKRPVVLGDRIVDRRCSEFLRTLTFRDDDRLDPYRWEN